MEIKVLIQAMAFTFGAFLVSMILTRLCVNLLPKLGFIDMPDERRVHKKPIPRGGGFAIIIAFFLFSLPLCVYNPKASQFLLAFAPPALIIILCGLLDDRFSLQAKVKLGIQIIAGFLLWWSPLSTDPIRLDFFFIILPEWLSITLTICMVIGVVNAFNLIDGLDGLAAGLSIVSALSLGAWAFALLQGSHMLLICLVLAGSCLGFLRYNFYPAKIFMGDTGSNFLGFFFAACCINSMSKDDTTVALLVPLIAIGLPILDVFLAIWRRGLRKLNAPKGSSGIMSADMDHLHHRIYASCQDQRKTAIIMYSIAAVFGLAGLSMILFKHGRMRFGYIILVIVGVMAVRKLATVEMLDSAKMILTGLSSSKKQRLIAMIHPIFDLFALVLAFVLTNYLVQKALLDNFWVTLQYIVIIYIILACSGVYKIVWGRSSVRDYCYLAEVLFLGSLVAWGAGLPVSEPWTDARAVFFFMWAIFFIVGERLILHYIEVWVVRELYVKNAVTKDVIDDVMIFGAGVGCRTYLAYLGYTYDDIYNIRGIIDDDTSLHGFKVMGYKVLGGRSNIAEIYAKQPFQRLVISSQSIDENVVEELREFANQNSIKVYVFTASERDITAKTNL